MESISANLEKFLKKTCNNLSVQDKKFLPDNVVTLLRCAKPGIRQVARHVPNKRNSAQYRFASKLTC